MALLVLEPKFEEGSRVGTALLGTRALLHRVRNHCLVRVHTYTHMRAHVQKKFHFGDVRLMILSIFRIELYVHTGENPQGRAVVTCLDACAC